MELKQFVTDTLTAIIEGIKDAQKSAIGEHVHPAWGVADKGIGIYRTGDGRLAYLVRFDVAVTVSESGSKEGGGKVNVYAVDIGGKKISSNAEQRVSRIQFDVPVTFPNPEHQ